MNDNEGILALDVVAQLLTTACEFYKSGGFPKFLDDYTAEDYKKLGFVVGLITELHGYRHDLFCEKLELTGKKYNGKTITLVLDYDLLLELGWIK